MENNNGKGIFYGVIGVATLVVAIIGATFAYFASTTQGETGAAAANSVNLAGTITLTDEARDTRTNLIPTTEAIMKQSYVQKGNAGTSKGKCNGVSKADGTSIFDLCSTYQFTLNNSASVAQTVYVTFETVDNGFTNLQYCIYEGVANSQVDNNPTACKAVPAKGAASADNSFNVNIEASGSKTYTVVLFVNETDGDQTTVDSGKTFTGTIHASTAGGGNNVTGVIAQS